jgi:hypothetical protein
MVFGVTWDGIRSAASGLTSKLASGAKHVASGISSAAHTLYDGAKGLASKAADTTVGKYMIEGGRQLKNMAVTGLHYAAEHAPAIGAAALGAIGDYYVPGSGRMLAQVGEKMGRGVRKWHEAKYGPHASKANATTAGGRFMRRAVKGAGRMAHAFNSAAGMTAMIGKRKKKPKAPPPVADWRGGTFTNRNL